MLVLRKLESFIVWQSKQEMLVIALNKADSLSDTSNLEFEVILHFGHFFFAQCSSGIFLTGKLE